MELFAASQESGDDENPTAQMSRWDFLLVFGDDVDENGWWLDGGRVTIDGIAHAGRFRNQSSVTNHWPYSIGLINTSISLFSRNFAA